ncbi:MAG: SpoIIE family protein phosphatase [Coriobacteriales bacterium]|nr:SpoIIE family protein phosphatase [Coriobacteriales bacterium]
MEDSSRIIRSFTFVILVVLALAMVATSNSFIQISLSHLLLILVPISIGALLLGAIGGCCIGIIAGVGQTLHALFIPLNYYERFFAHSANTIIVFVVFGLVVGLLYAKCIRYPKRGDLLEGGGISKGGKRIAAIAIASLIGSAAASLCFLAGVRMGSSAPMIGVLIDSLAKMVTAGNMLAQVLIDAVIVAVVAVAIDFLYARYVAYRSNRSISFIFRVTFLAIMVTAILFFSGFTYLFITVSTLYDADYSLQDQIGYVQTVLGNCDAMADDIAKDTNLSDAKRDQLKADLIYDTDVDLKGWRTDIVLVAKNDTIILANNGEYLGRSLSGVLTAGLETGVTSDTFDSDFALEFYTDGIEPSYMRVSKFGEFQIMAAIESSEIFSYRTVAMVIVLVALLILFGMIFPLAFKLIDRFMVKSINDTNSALERITAGDLSVRVPEGNSREFKSLSSGINTTVDALSDAIEAESARLDSELATAKAIQENSLPRIFPPFPDIDRFDLYAGMDPAKEVGGDFYDFFELEGPRVGLVMADVSGKGIPAALFMMAAKSQIHGFMTTESTLAEAIKRANLNLCSGNETHMFVTVFAAIFDFERYTLTYVNAGHNPQLIRRGSEWEWLRSRSGMMLGVFPNAKYEQFETTLEPGDELFMYTDGVTEAWSPDEQMYGEERLKVFLEQHQRLHPRRLLRALRAELAIWANGAEQSDDITMMALACGQVPEYGDTLVTEAKLENFDDVLDFVDDQLRRADCSKQAANQIRIAVEELVVNVCKYAYPDATDEKPGALRVHCTYAPANRSFTVEVSDDGVPFNPLEREDPEIPKDPMALKPGGLGILMVKKMMDNVAHYNEFGANVNVITKYW